MFTKAFSAVLGVWVLCWPALSGAQQPAIRAGASLYIAEMDADLDGFLRAEFVKQHVPLNVVLSRENAHIVMVGTSGGNEKRSWHEGWLTSEKDHAVGNVTVIDRKSGAMLWAAEAGDRSLIWGSLARGGQRKVAARIVGQLKKSIVAGAPLPPPPPLSRGEVEASREGAPDTTTATKVQAIPEQPPLTNADVLNLIHAGLGDELVVRRIHSGSTAFALGTDDLVALKKAGVSDKVVSAMMERQTAH